MNAIARTVIIGTIESRERKIINEKNLCEFYVAGVGLKISAWGDIATKPEVGKPVVVEGSLRTRSYEYEGKQRQSTEIVASSIEFIEAAAADDDDLPF